MAERKNALLAWRGKLDAKRPRLTGLHLRCCLGGQAVSQSRQLSTFSGGYVWYAAGFWIAWVEGRAPVH